MARKLKPIADQVEIATAVAVRQLALEQCQDDVHARPVPKGGERREGESSWHSDHTQCVSSYLGVSG